MSRSGSWACSIRAYAYSLALHIEPNAEPLRENWISRYRSDPTFLTTCPSHWSSPLEKNRALDGNQLQLKSFTTLFVVCSMHTLASHLTITLDVMYQGSMGAVSELIIFLPVICTDDTLLGYVITRFLCEVCKQNQDETRSMEIQ